MTSLVLEMNLMKIQLPVKVTQEVQLSEEYQIPLLDTPTINKNMLYQQDLIAVQKVLSMLEFQTMKFCHGFKK